MWKVVVTALIALTGLPAVAAEVVYIKRSELWAHDFGQQLGQGVGQYAEWNGHVSRRDADQVRLGELKKAIAACNNQCADRQRLVTEADELDARLKQFDNMLCGTFRALKQLSTPARDAAIMKAFRIGHICPDLADKDNATLDREFFEKQRKRIAAGDLNAYADMGMRHLDDRDRTWLERSQAGCALLYRGAVLGNARSTRALAYYCMNAETSTEDERKAFVALLRACSDRGENTCTGYLGALYHPVENRARNAPFPVDEKEALRLWDLAASRGDAGSETSALQLRQRMRSQESMATPSPWIKEPIERPPRPQAAVAEPAVEESRSAPAARRPSREAAALRASAQCERLAEIVERHRQAAQADASRQRRLAASTKAYARRCSDR
ncbi:hypothetical protein [Ideonella sp. A 288]|uniref:hypothetical protein n=1 Tax=Ideonella sp. A 288 TaxID=1962181 RepID=UPI000B4A7CAD|nr:hypothetical protein [Ideonella sp. A 288]